MNGVKIRWVELTSIPLGMCVGMRVSVCVRELFLRSNEQKFAAATTTTTTTTMAPNETKKNCTVAFCERRIYEYEMNNSCCEPYFATIFFSRGIYTLTWTPSLSGPGNLLTAITLRELSFFASFLICMTKDNRNWNSIWMRLRCVCVLWTACRSKSVEQNLFRTALIAVSRCMCVNRM